MWISEKIELNDWKLEELGDCDGWFVKMSPPWSKFEIDAGVWRPGSGSGFHYCRSRSICMQLSWLVLRCSFRPYID